MQRKSLSALLGTRKKNPAQQLRRKTALKKRLFVENLETRLAPAIITFQEGVLPPSYTGNVDTILYSVQPNVNFGTETGMSVDQQDVGGVRQGLVRFDNIFGNGANQIPVGSTITSAKFVVECFNDSNAAMQMSIYRMLVSWDEASATWNSFGSVGGVQASQGESTELPPDGILFDSTTGPNKEFDVTRSLRYWSAGAPNNGWLLESAATNGWDFNTSEASAANRPKLVVDYVPPVADSQQWHFPIRRPAPGASRGEYG